MVGERQAFKDYLEEARLTGVDPAGGGGSGGRRGPLGISGGADILPPGSQGFQRIGFGIPSVTDGQGFAGFGGSTASLGNDLTDANSILGGFEQNGQLTGGFSALFKAFDKRSGFEKFMEKFPSLAKTGAKAMKGFEGAMASAFMAMVTGSDSALKAFKKFMGGKLLADAAGMFGEAGVQGVKAFGSLVSGNPAKAAGHAKTAAMALAQAAALTALAAGMGATGKQGGAGASVGGGLGGGGAGIAAGDGHTTNIFTGDDFMTGRERSQRMGQYIDIGRREGDRSTVTFN